MEFLILSFSGYLKSPEKAQSAWGQLAGRPATDCTGNELGLPRTPAVHWRGISSGADFLAQRPPAGSRGRLGGWGQQDQR